MGSGSQPARRPPRSKNLGNFTDTASLVSVNGTLSEPLSTTASQTLAMIEQFDKVTYLNRSEENSKGIIATGKTLNEGLAAERRLLPFYFGLAVVGLATVALASAAVSPEGIYWGAKVGLGTMSVASAGILVKMIGAIVKMRNQISADHLKFMEISLHAQNHRDDMERRERFTLLGLIQAHPEKMLHLIELNERLFGKPDTQHKE
jgi:hypothetical protein